MFQKTDGRGIGCLALAFLIGGIAGASIALLSAPQSGRETRRLIKGLVKETLEEPEEYLEDIKCKLSAIVEEAEDYIDGLKKKLTPAE